MTLDPTLTLTHRLELEAELVRVRRDAKAREVRIAARQAIAAEIVRVQTAIAVAEERILAQLPTPLPSDAEEVLSHHPAVVGRRRQLERFEQIFAVAQLDQAESVARAITGESQEPLSAPSPKPGRRPKQSGTDGGTP